MKIIVKLWILLLGLQVLSIYAGQETKTKTIPIEKTLFVNGRVNDVLLVVTDHKNKQFQVPIKIGAQYGCIHKPLELKKVVCYEKLAVNTTLSKTDLDMYAVFVFNAEKLEKFNFINIRQKEAALKLARSLKNETLFNEISEQTVYNP